MTTNATGSPIATTEPPMPINATNTTDSLINVTNDQPTSSASRTTDPTTDMVTQGHMISASNLESSSSILGPAVGGVVGGLIVIIAFIAVVIIALLFIKRGQKGSLKVNDRKESVQGYNNALYDGK